MNEIEKYFPNLSKEQIEKLNKLIPLYTYWNSKVNLISRRDIDNLFINHILHSLAIVKIINFKDGSNVLDVGTGGGFPGIPLSIFFPNVNFTLLDSIGKKIKVVESISNDLSLKNVRTVNDRVENHFDKYEFIVSRAVSRMNKFYSMVSKNINSKSLNKLPNGIVSLKGGDLENELKEFKNNQIYEISEFFSYDFFETKKIVYIPYSN
ncbi:MAG: 16S rRNA (guanine(527)-N(7))-methyltransferase RsmG [Flavobacteriaceae bacterium]|nr:16S rRNA (guanine(527)-N(7))-methyltransferase RsmG [Cryomorphaceae bacterium]MDG1888975.1 16S rRNA (guanine(527)-N(7))-methyltransferase RsmG [Flavobacteriaceae bacterium]